MTTSHSTLLPVASGGFATNLSRQFRALGRALKNPKSGLMAEWFLNHSIISLRESGVGSSPAPATCVDLFAGVSGFFFLFDVAPVFAHLLIGSSHMN